MSKHRKPTNCESIPRATDYDLLLWFKTAREVLAQEQRFVDVTGRKMPKDRLGWLELAAAYQHPRAGSRDLTDGEIYAWVMGQAQKKSAAKKPTSNVSASKRRIRERQQKAWELHKAEFTNSQIAAQLNVHESTVSRDLQ